MKPFLIGLLAFAVCAASLHGGFLAWDDRSLILDNPVAALPPWSAVRHAFFHPVGTTYWPLRELSYSVDHWLWGGFSAFGFHLTNLLLYAAVAAGVYLAARRALGEVTALLGAVLFALHPLHAEPAAWASGRKDLLCAAWILLAWWALPRPDGEGRRTARYALAFVAYVAACLSKSAALPFPLVWWASDRILGIRRPFSWLERGPFLVAMVLLGLGQAGLSLGAGAAGRYEAGMPGWQAALVTPCLALVDQLGALLLPLGLAPSYPLVGEPWGLLRWISWALVLASAAGLAVFLKRRLRMPASPRLRAGLFGLAWTVLFLLPVINLGLPTSTPRADRYTFLPSIGFCLAAAALLLALKPGRLAMGILLASMACLTSAQAASWKNDLTLWRPVLRRQPRSFHAAGGLGWGYALSGKLDRSRHALNRLIRIAPDSPVAHHQLAGLYKTMGQIPEALFEYGQANQLYEAGGKGRGGVRVPSGYRREHAQCLLEMGEVVFTLGQAQAAVSHAQKAVGLAPEDERASALLGLWRGATGDLVGAAAACEQAIRLAPGLPDGHWHRAKIAQLEGDQALDGERLEEAWVGYERLAGECRWMVSAGCPTPEVLSRLAYAEIRLSMLSGDAREVLAHRDEAETVYRQIPLPSETDLQNLATLLRFKAEAFEAQGDFPHAYAAAHQASVCQPGDAGLHAMAARFARASGRVDLALPHERTP